MKLNLQSIDWMVVSGSVFLMRLSEAHNFFFLRAIREEILISFWCPFLLLREIGSVKYLSRARCLLSSFFSIEKILLSAGFQSNPILVLRDSPTYKRKLPSFENKLALICLGRSQTWELFELWIFILCYKRSVIQSSMVNKK